MRKLLLALLLLPITISAQELQISAGTPMRGPYVRFNSNDTPEDPGCAIFAAPSGEIWHKMCPDGACVKNDQGAWVCAPYDDTDLILKLRAACGAKEKK